MIYEDMYAKIYAMLKWLLWKIFHFQLGFHTKNSTMNYFRVIQVEWKINSEIHIQKFVVNIQNNQSKLTTVLLLVMMMIWC